MLKRIQPFFVSLLIVLTIVSCTKNQETIEEQEAKKTPLASEFGFTYADFNVIHDTIKKGDTFGSIIEKQNIGDKKVYDIIEKVKDTFDVRIMRYNKPYVLLRSKHKKNKLQVFIYQPGSKYIYLDDFTIDALKSSE